MGVIDGNDIIKDDHLANAIKNAEKYLDITKQTTAAIVEEAKALRDLVAVNPMKGAKDFTAMAAALRESTKAVKEYNSVQEKSRKVQKEITVATAAETKAKIEKQEQTKKLNTLLREEIALEDKQIGTLKKLAIESNRLRRERDNLNLETAEGVKRAKEINQQLDLNNQKLIAFSDANKRAKLNVGNYTESINKARIGMLNLASAFGIATGVYAFTSALRGAFNIISENEDAFASLSAITGLTGEKFEVFRTAITNTASELKVSSTEVASAAEKIASAQPKLLESADALAGVTKEAITLNKAIKGDLTETSMALVGVMNQFGYGAEEATRVINVLAAGSKAGAATVNQLNESMIKSGSVAKLQGLEVEELTGAIETLGEKAIFGADAGTALRNILLKMGGIDALPKKAIAELEKYGVDTEIVGDKTLSFSERLKELSKIAGDSTAIMKVFGIENATAATILLNNIDTYDNMTAAVTGTNVAQEQAAINSDTLSNVVKELGAAWDNLVIKWSEGTDVAGGLKDVLRFVTENLETIISWVVKGITVWGSYRLALLAVNKEGTGFLQLLRNMVLPAQKAAGAVGQMAESTKKARIGFAGWVGIMVALLPMLWDAGKAVFSLFNHTQSLDKVTEQLTLEMDKERAKMELLWMEYQNLNGTTEERKKWIDKVNGTYGTTIKNVENEALMIFQLEKAYKAVIAQMEKKLKAQLMEEEYLDLLRRKREAERYKGTSVDPITAFIEGQWNAAELDDINKEIENLRKEMFGDGLLGETGKTLSQRVGGRPTPIEAALGLDEEGKKKIAKDVKDIENIIEELPDGPKFESFLDVEKYYNDIVEFDKEDLLETRDEDLEIQPEDIISKATAAEIKEIYDSITESVNRLSEALQELIQLRVDELDVAIGQKKDRVQMHEERINQFKELAAEGNLTAQQSIKAEEMRVSNLQADIAALEQKKQKLLVINLALQTATNLAEGGDGSAIAKATEQITGMISKIKSFKSGTDQTGRGNVDKDGGFHAILHPDEIVMQKELADPLRARGLDRFDVATYAMAYHDDMINGRAMMGGSFGEVLTLATLNGIRSEVSEMKEELKSLPKKMPVYKQDYDANRQMMVDIIKVDNEINRYFKFIKK